MGEQGLRNHIGKWRERNLNYMVITLMGIFNGGIGSRNHLQAITNATDSKLNVRWWM